jgi:hypothetical protein
MITFWRNLLHPFSEYKSGELYPKDGGSTFL